MRLIAQVSDIHFGRHSTEVSEHLLASLQSQSPDLLIFSGDFTQRARREEFAEARRFLERIPQPKLVVPGNHDVPLYNPVARFFRPLEGYNRDIAPLGQPGNFFRDDEIAVLGLDTARRLTTKNGRVSLRQMVEIEQTFGRVPETTFKVLVTHHPLGAPMDERSFELAGRSALAIDAARAAGVHLLLSGHHHRALSGDLATVGAKDSVLIVYAGTAISSRVRGGHANSYNLICLDGETLTVAVFEWVGREGFEERRRTSFKRVDARWVRA